MLSQAQVEQNIMRYLATLEKVTHEMAEAAMEAAHADADYKRAFNAAFLMAQAKTITERERLAEFETADEYDRKRIAEALLKTLEDKGRNVRSGLDALRSVNSNLRNLVTQ